MNANDLLEHRAQHGAPRGASEVWAAAQTVDAAPGPARRLAWSSLVFRGVLLVGVFGLLATGLTQWATAIGDEAESTQAAQDDREPGQSGVALPAPILIEGGTLTTDYRSVVLPADRSSSGDDDFLDRVLPNPRSPVRVPESSSRAPHVVYARPEDPFGGPIVGLELPASGGFRPWGANLTQEELTNIALQVQNADGRWSIPEDSGLIVVAEIQTGDEMRQYFDSWQFTFDIDGDREVVLQAEPVNSDDQEWVWLTRMAGTDDDSGTSAIPTIRPIDVLGTTGYVIETPGSSGDAVIWASEGYLYRMMVSHVENDTSIDESAADEISRLRLADRAEWESTIATSLRTSPSEWIGYPLGVGVLIASGLCAIYFAIKRSFRSAAIAALTLFGFYATTSIPPRPITAVLAGAGLAAAWWLHVNASRVLPAKIAGTSRDEVTHGDTRASEGPAS